MTRTIQAEPREMVLEVPKEERVLLGSSIEYQIGKNSYVGEVTKVIDSGRGTLLVTSRLNPGKI